jgi:Tfp pilus assembly protein FimT
MPDIRRIEADKKAGRRRSWRSEKGFTTIEMAVCCLIIGIATGIAIINTTHIFPTLRADSSLELVVAQLRQAREQAMDERRNFVVTFEGTNEITVYRVELPIGNQTPTQTLIADVFLGQGMVYTVLPGVPDTPDQFGDVPAVNLAGGNTVTFLSDGTVLSSTGQPWNGSIIMGIPGQIDTARAITVMSATGQIQGYRFNGSAWN